MTFNIVGVTFRNKDGSLRQEIIQDEVKENDLLTMRREPDNEYDPNAIAIFSSSGNQVGYIPRDLAKILKDEDLSTYKLVVNEKVCGSKRRIYGIKATILQKYYDTEDDELDKFLAEIDDL